MVGIGKYLLFGCLSDYLVVKEKQWHYVMHNQERKFTSWHTRVGVVWGRSTNLTSWRIMVALAT